MRNSPTLLMLPLLLLPAHFAEGAPKKVPLAVTTTVAGLPVTVQNGFVNVIADNNDALRHVNLEKDALTPFTAVLRAYPRADSFALSWYQPVIMDATGAAVQYDRVKHTFTVDYFYGGGDGPEYVGRVRFTHVRESVFAAILEAHPNGVPRNDAASEKIASVHSNNADEWGGFQYLYQPRYGCHVFVVRSHRRRHLRHTAH